MEYQHYVQHYDMLNQVNEWCEQNHELIMRCMMLVTQSYSGSEVPTCQPVTQYVNVGSVKKYQDRRRPIKATEHERARSRAYYIANREAILEKRRLHNLKLKRYQKNLKTKDRPMKS